MTALEHMIIDFMIERKRCSYRVLEFHFINRPFEFPQAFSDLIDSNKLEEFHENGIKFIKLGMAD